MSSKVDSSIKVMKPNIHGGIASANNKLTLVEQMHFLYVKIIGASNLPKGTRDPFLELKMGNYKRTTRCACVQDTLNPIQNQVFAIAIDGLQAKRLEILLRDITVDDDEIIGLVSFDIGNVPTRLPWDSPLAPQWYKLEDHNGFIIRVDLMLAIWIGNQADDAFSVAWHSNAANVSDECVMNTRPKIYFSPRLWCVRVSIIEVQDLVLPDRNRTPDVYVKAMLGNLVLGRKILVSNRGWNQEFLFVAAEPFEDDLVLSLEDRVSHKKVECLGRCVIPLHKLDKMFLSPPPEDRWVNLERIVIDEEKEAKFAGKLHWSAFLDGAYHAFDEPTQFRSDLQVIGLLELGILKAEGLMPMKKSQDGNVTTDAYCVAKYGPKWIRTSTVVSSLAPKWNEQYKWEVYDPCTVITIGVFDNCNLHGSEGTMDSVIGKVRIRLSTLETNRIYAHSYPLLSLNPNGLMKMGELHLVVRFSCISMVNLLSTYTRPLLPVTHYIGPLSAYQLNNLNYQAAYHVSSRLSGAIPPLRREIVEYLLDDRTPMWSIRKGKANWDRVMGCLIVLADILNWFDQIRQWNNSVKTICIWLLLIFLIIFPEAILLPSFFLYLAFVGVRNYWKRPRLPPGIDTKLSHVEDVSPDDLDEEFDSFPSSRRSVFVRMRYDRLRSTTGRLIKIIGDLASQLERVYALVSWRDPRATPMFVVFCMITSITLYIVPFRWLLVVAVSYALKPPRLHAKDPLILQNFLRRMPTREDNML